MKSRFVFFILVVFTMSFNSIYSQSDDDTSILLKKGDSLFKRVFEYHTYYFAQNIRYLKGDLGNNLNLDTAQERKVLNELLGYYSNYLKKNNSFNYRVNIKIGMIYFRLHDIPNSIKYFEYVVSNNQTRKAYVSDVERSLAELYYLNKEYKKALKYENRIFLSKNYYTCGNAKAEDDIYNSLLFSKIYYELNDFEKALDYCLPHIFNFQLMRNDDLVNFSDKLIKEQYDLLIVQNELKNSIEHIKATSNENGDKIYYIEFLNRKIKAPFLTMKEIQKDVNNDEKVKEKIKKSRFYKLLMN